MILDAGAAITVSGLTKVFNVPTERRQSLKQHFTSLFRPISYRRHQALRDLSFEVEQGEFFSIIGHNGSGKSTLLKILAGIYQPTKGTVRICGRLSPFIELGVGFNTELTARENVYLNGVILGLSRAEIDRQFDDIIEFAELEDFIDQRLKNFSSGMLVRLAFSVAIRAHADILLIDEVLAVGDTNFQEKCFDVFRLMKADRKTIVFVSHDLGSVKEFSDRVLVLDQGLPRAVTTPGQAIALYHRLMEEHLNDELQRSGAPSQERPITDRPALRRVELFSEGRSTHLLHRGENATVRVTIDNPRQVPVQAGVAVFRTDGLYCFGTNTLLGEFEPSQDREITLDVTFERLLLQQGSYYLGVGVFGARDSNIYEFRDRVYDFEVTHRDGYEGLVYLPHTWRWLAHQRDAESPPE